MCCLHFRRPPSYPGAMTVVTRLSLCCHPIELLWCYRVAMPFLYLPALFLWLLLAAASVAAAERLTISLQAPASLQSHPVAGQAIDDSLQLLKRSFPAASVGRKIGRAHV